MTRPTKITNTRSKNVTGDSVEVDALPAPVLRQIVEKAITRHIDPNQLAITQQVELEERATFERLAAEFR